MTTEDQGFLTALEEAKGGASEGGVPIGACLVSKGGQILGRGHNMRVQKGSATLHVGSTKTVHTLRLNSDAMPVARPKSRALRTLVDSQLPHIKAQPCTRPFLRVICVRELVCYTRSLE